jgi:MATE family multidrug resistance protein
MVVLQKSVSHFSLSKYPLGGFKELFSLSLPVSIVLLSGALMGFCDRLFLSYDSLENLEGCVDAAFLCYLFQISLIFGARTTQIFVGECFGSNRFHDVGSYVWQMIWLSLFSMVFTLPLGRVAELLFFRGTVVEEAGTTYFRCLMSFNFLFPLATALSSFYIGRGKINIIFWSTLISNIVNLILDPIFIFGLPGWNGCVPFK